MPVPRFPIVVVVNAAYTKVLAFWWVLLGNDYVTLTGLARGAGRYKGNYAKQEQALGTNITQAVVKSRTIEITSIMMMLKIYRLSFINIFKENENIFGVI